MTKRRNFQIDYYDGQGFFTVSSRVVQSGVGRVFSEGDRDYFRQLMRNTEKFAGVKVIAWTMVADYFRILVEVPEQEVLDEEGVKRRCRAIYDGAGMARVELQFAEAHSNGERAVDELVAKYQRRMGSLPEFVKTLKQKFTMYYNRENDRVGVLWESRFESMLVEERWTTLSKVAAYIDLSPVREGLVDDPGDYEWCSYAEAAAGKREARRGYVAAYAVQSDETPSWRVVHPEYREIMFGAEGGDAEAARAGWRREALENLVRTPAKMSLQQLLRCRLRYFESGRVVGQKGFVEKFFEDSREAFAEARETGARKMRGSAWDGLYTVRAMRDPISVP